MVSYNFFPYNQLIIYIYIFLIKRLYPVDSNRLDDGRGILEKPDEAVDVTPDKTSALPSSDSKTDAKTEKKTN